MNTRRTAQMDPAGAREISEQPSIPTSEGNELTQLTQSSQCVPHAAVSDACCLESVATCAATGAESHDFSLYDIPEEHLFNQGEWPQS